MASEALSLDSFFTKKTTNGKMQDKALMDLFDLISLGLSPIIIYFIWGLTTWAILTLVHWDYWFYLPGTEVNTNHQKCSITYRSTWHGCTIFLPLRETIEESAKRRHLWQYWAKWGAARCPECNADSSIGSRGCEQIGLQGRVWGRYRTLFANTKNYKTLW